MSDCHLAELRVRLKSHASPMQIDRWVSEWRKMLRDGGVPYDDIDTLIAEANAYAAEHLSMSTLDLDFQVKLVLAVKLNPLEGGGLTRDAQTLRRCIASSAAMRRGQRDL